MLREIVTGAADDCLLVDPWNAFGTAQVFGYTSELSAMRGMSAEVDDGPLGRSAEPGKA